MANKFPGRHDDSQKCHSFNELLAVGRDNFADPANDKTGLEDHSITGKVRDQLLNLNSYMYTTYSTNSGCQVLSIEGVCPLSIFKRIEPDLLKQSYWYIAKNPLDLVEHGSNIPPKEEFEYSMSRQTLVGIIRKDKFKGYRAPPWKVLGTFKDEVVAYNDDVAIHFIEPGADPAHYNSNETLLYTDEALFRGDDPLVSVVVEDPIVGRISMYNKLYEFLRVANS